MAYNQPERAVSSSSTNLKAREAEAIVLSAATSDPITETVIASVVRLFHSVFDKRRKVAQRHASATFSGEFSKPRRRTYQ
ncbi:hypothetical protein ACQR1W_23750 [Bradyrhizobium sp. HKCCYLS1011]|uniref:hypothetical protein n=1 Tax=Bradyrhizobium sp. HKCCYLS1011 TaxID=3420733 RepID=UPI003EBEF94E